MSTVLVNPQISLTPSVLQIQEAGVAEPFYAVATSGSSSLTAKWVVLSKVGFDQACLSINQFFKTSISDIWALALPTYHVGGLSVTRRAQLSQSQVVVFDKSWSPTGFYQFIVDHKVTMISLVPTQIFDLVHLKLKAPSSLRYVLVGGAPLEGAWLTQALDLGWNLCATFGMTETSAMMAYKKNIFKPEYSCFDHVRVRVSGEGYLQIQSQSLFLGWCYHDKQQWQFEPRVLDSQGYWTSQDLATKGPGPMEFCVKGRSSDFIKIKGEGLALNDLRARFNQHCGWRQEELNQMALCAPQEARQGHRLILVVDPRIHVQAQAVVESWNLSCPSFERLELVILDSALWPRSPLGKIQWAKLEQMICDLDPRAWAVTE